MRLLPLGLFLLALPMLVLAQAPDAALSGKRTFKTPAAGTAQASYSANLEAARRNYATELDPAIKAAMKAGSLDDANALNTLKKKVESGGLPEIPGAPSRYMAANTARSRFETAVVAAQRQYAGALQAALKGAMAAADLDEANTISSELKALGVVAAAPGVTTATKPAIGLNSGRSGPGLILTRYPMLPSQKGDAHGGGYVPYTDFGPPLGAPHTIKSLSEWSKDKSENAVASGFIRIDQPGQHDFTTDSDYDRNELWIDGQIVCKFQDTSNGIATVELTAGLHPVVCVGYVHITDEVRVKWKPPGALKFTEIPNNLLSH